MRLSSFLFIHSLPSSVLVNVGSMDVICGIEIRAVPAPITVSALIVPPPAAEADVP